MQILLYVLVLLTDLKSLFSLSPVPPFPSPLLSPPNFVESWLGDQAVVLGHRRFVGGSRCLREQS